MANRKLTCYIASPYTQGDMQLNVFFQHMIFNELILSNLVIPIAPLWSHYQHVILPLPYEDWIAYDNSLLPLYDCCLRLDAIIGDYHQHESLGADAEVQQFLAMNKPVFYSIEELEHVLRKA